MSAKFHDVSLTEALRDGSHVPASWLAGMEDERDVLATQVSTLRQANTAAAAHASELADQLDAATNNVARASRAIWRTRMEAAEAQVAKLRGALAELADVADSLHGIVEGEYGVFGDEPSPDVAVIARCRALAAPGDPDPRSAYGEPPLPAEEAERVRREHPDWFAHERAPGDPEPEEN